MRNGLLTLVQPESTNDGALTAERQELRFRRLSTSSQQLLFPFMEEQVDRSIFIIAMDQIHGARLSESISRIKPKLALDVRSLVRFDLPGTSRNEIFLKLKSENARYVRDSISWQDLEAKHFMTGHYYISHVLYHEVTESGETPIMLFTSKISEVRLLFSYLNKVVSSGKFGSWRIEHIE